MLIKVHGFSICRVWGFGMAGLLEMFGNAKDMP